MLGLGRCSCLRRGILSLYLPLPRFATTSIGSSETAEENGKLYDLSNYELPYSVKERSFILETINDASAEDLARLKVTKGVIKKLIKTKSHIGSYEDLSQLLYMDGMGVKAVENLCTLVLKNKDINNYSDDLEDELESIVYKKRLVKPKLCPYIIQNIQTLVSLHVTAGFLAWTKFDCNGKVLDLYSEELLNSDMRFDALKIYEKVAGVAKRIPSADLYVWEERSNYGHLHKATLGTVIISLQLAQIKGMLTALLNSRHEEGEGSRLIHVREILVTKLFSLQIGEDRISGLNLADTLMEGRQDLKWLPPLLMEEGVQELYFSTEKTHRRYMATSLFVGIAFYHAVLQHNKNALRMLWR